MTITKSSAIGVFLLSLGVMWYLCLDDLNNTSEPPLTVSMLEESEERVVEKTDAVQRVLQQARTDAAAVASRVESHVETLDADDVASGLNSLLEYSRMERRGSDSSEGVDDTGSRILDD